MAKGEPLSASPALKEFGRHLKDAMNLKLGLESLEAIQAGIIEGVLKISFTERAGPF